MRSHGFLLAALLTTATLASLVPGLSALPTPGFFCDLSEPVTGRVFPDAMQTNDFVSYKEARCGLAKLEKQFPDLIRVEPIGESVGWSHVVTQAKEPHEVFAVRVTNAKSPIPAEDKIRILYMLSIHGNEKGGREGGLRVIEDFAKPQLAGLDGKYVEMLDYMELLFLFPNPDGWTHEELEYRHNDACYRVLVPHVSCTVLGRENVGKPGVESQNFVRFNGNGVDLNREAPTAGWYNEPYTALSEPEAQGSIAWMRNLTNLKYATDIHGMLNPADGVTPVDCVEASVDPSSPCSHPMNMRGHFVLTMLPAGRQDAHEMTATTALADAIKEALNNDPAFAEWRALPTSAGLWGGEFNEWGTVWDTIGYTDSGFHSDFFAQDRGLDVPGVDFELAYNHVTFDNYYPGAAQRINAYHVESVRVIVRLFMDAAAKDLEVRIDQAGVPTAYLTVPTEVTSGSVPLEGWAKENPADDGFDYENRPFTARPQDYFEDLAPFLRDGDAPGVLDPIGAEALTDETLARYKAFIVAGSAARSLEGNEEAVAALKGFVEAGGRLLLTDEALKLLEPLGLAKPGSVGVSKMYAGHTNFEVGTDHPLLKDVRGLARQTYEPVALGYSVRDGGNAPGWHVARDALTGEALGHAPRGNLAQVNFGEAALGAGKVVFLGALLPDPTTEFYHPYGLESYATTYTGNQLLRNALGWTLHAEETPVDPLALGKTSAPEAPAKEAPRGIPTVGAVAVLALLGMGAALLRRRS